MAVRVHQARQHQAPAEIDAARGGAGEGQDLRVGADRGDGAAAHRHRLRLGARRVQGQDGTVEQHEIGGRLRGAGGAGDPRQRQQAEQQRPFRDPGARSGAGGAPGPQPEYRAHRHPSFFAAACRTRGRAFSMSNFGSLAWSWQVAHTPWMMQNEHWSVMP